VLSVGWMKEEGDHWWPWSLQQGRVSDQHWGCVNPCYVEYQGCCSDLQVNAALRLPGNLMRSVVGMILEVCGVAVVAVVIE